MLGEGPDGLLEGIEAFEFHAEHFWVGHEGFAVEFLELALDRGVTCAYRDAEPSGDFCDGDSGLPHFEDASISLRNKFSG